MVLEAVPAGIVVSIATEVGEDKQGGAVLVFGIALNLVPDIRAVTVCVADALDV